MADTESQREAGRRLARDLRSIRRSRSIDLKEVLDATRLADDVIEQLEETALMGNPMFNRVYLRSMFSSYASVLGIGSADMMTALEEAMAGHYIGSLARKYLGETGSDAASEGADEDEASSDTSAPHESQEEETSSEGETEEDGDLGKASGPLTKAGETGIVVHTDAPDLAAQDVGDQEVDTQDEEVQSLEPGSETEPKKSFPGYTGVRTPVDLAPAKPKTTVLLPNMSGFLMLVFAGLALIALIWFAVSWVLKPKVDLEEQLSPPDSTSISMAERPERIVLPDTMIVHLIAFEEALDPIRVKVDRDLRRPYWIEHMDTLSFTMRNVVEFEREVDHALIVVSGYVIPSSWYDSEVRAEITREMTQAWLDSLTQAGVFPPRSQQ